MGLKPGKLLIGLSVLWASLIMVLGLWWLFLIVQISRELERDMMRMVRWEGAVFLLCLLAISTTLFYLYWQDLKKHHSLASFFASLSHELKTPLASMRLQAEVLRETVQEGGDGRLQALTSRLIEDAQRLEDELDKLLQLSRMERGGRLHLERIALADFFPRFRRKLHQEAELEITGDGEGAIWGDEFSLHLVLRNLVDNSLKHARSRRISISLRENPETIQMRYDDHGPSYRGDPRHLGKLFYKAPHSKGQGIGLYLCQTLLDKMGGSLQIISSPHLIFHLTFARYQGEEESERTSIHSDRGR